MIPDLTFLSCTDSPSLCLGENSQSTDGKHILCEESSPTHSREREENKGSVQEDFYTGLLCAAILNAQGSLTALRKYSHGLFFTFIIIQEKSSFG